jgi:hypothetical protein
MYKVPQHIWRTESGVLVPHGHPDARILAYAAGDELSDNDAKTRGVLAVYPEKSRRKPMDKAMPKPADKSGELSTESKELNHG